LLYFQINLIAPPLYVVTTQTLERMDGLAALNKALEAIKANIEEAGGMFNIQLQVQSNMFIVNVISSCLFLGSLAVSFSVSFLLSVIRLFSRAVSVDPIPGICKF